MTLILKSVEGVIQETREEEEEGHLEAEERRVRFATCR